MSLTVQRFFISLDQAREGDRLHADLCDNTSLLLVLRRDAANQRWYITIDERDLPPSLVSVGRRVAIKALRERDDYDYGHTVLRVSEINELALDICAGSRVLGAVKAEGGAYISVGTRLSALVGSNADVDVPAHLQERWYATSRLASLSGRPVSMSPTAQRQP